MLSAHTARLAETQYQQLIRTRWLMVAALVFVIVFSTLADFTLGPSALTWPDLFQTLLQPSTAEPTVRVIVWEFRLPYSMMAVAVGSGPGTGGR